jgi:hypothetical protein
MANPGSAVGSGSALVTSVTALTNAVPSTVASCSNSYKLISTKNFFQCCGFGSRSGSAFILVGWIQIQEGQNDPQKIQFEVLDVLIFRNKDFSRNLDVLYGGFRDK